MIYRFLFLPTILLFSLVIGCNEPDEAQVEFSGITYTSPMSPEPIGSVDSDDWRPLFECPPATGDTTHTSDTVAVVAQPIETAPSPVYPNPVSDYCNFQFALCQSDSIIVTLNEHPNIVVFTLVKERMESGMHEIRIDVTKLNPKIYRLYFSVVRPNQIFTTYGDIQVTR
jgi:hypothetical protein